MIGLGKRMRPYLKQIALALVVLLAVVYAYDALSVRHRMSAQKSGDPFDTVTYPHLLAIPQKGNKVDYELDATSPMQTVPCVHSLFPHYGYTPCWYIKRNAKLPTQMNILLPRISAEVIQRLFAVRPSSIGF